MADLKLSLVVEAIDRATAVFRQVSQAVGLPAAAAEKGLARIQSGAEGVTNAVAGIGLGVGAAIELKEIVGTAEYFDRLRINSGASAETVDHLREVLLETAKAARIPSDELTASLKGVLASGQGLGFFQDNIKSLATGIQLLNGDGEELGQSFAQLSNKLQIKSPEELAQAFATVRQQLRGVAGGFDEFAPQLGRLSADYALLGQSGLQASKDLGALYALVRLGTTTNRQATGGVENLIHFVQDKSGRDAIKSLNISVADTPEDERNNRLRPLPDIISDIAKTYVQNPALVEARLGPGIVSPLKVGFGEIAQTGRLDTLDRKRAITGDPAKDAADAAQIGTNVSGSINAVNDAVKGAAESFEGLFSWIAKLVAPVAGLIGNFVAFAGSLIFLGNAIKLTRTWGGAALDEFVGIGRALFSIGPTAAGIALRLAAVTESIGGLVSGIPLLGPLFSGLSAGFLSVGLAIEATPIGWILTGIAAIAGAAYLIYENWGGISSYFEEKWSAVKTAFDQSWTNGIVVALQEFNPVAIVGDAMDALVLKLTGVDLYDVGKKIVGTLKSGLTDAFGDYGSQVASVAADGAKSALAAVSPTLAALLALTSTSGAAAPIADLPSSLDAPRQSFAAPTLGAPAPTAVGSDRANPQALARLPIDLNLSLAFDGAPQGLRLVQTRSGDPNTRVNANVDTGLGMVAQP
ncbi:MAG TPA: hypothetical protein VM689_13360 [Aliidongia sp.]|nr:hypothetical protein [Aliidongia sp.]